MSRSLECPVEGYRTTGRYIYLRGTLASCENGCPPSILPQIGLGSYNTFDSAALNAFSGLAQGILHRPDVPHAQRDRECVSWTWWTKPKSHGVPADVTAVTNVGGESPYLHRSWRGGRREDSRAPSPRNKDVIVWSLLIPSSRVCIRPHTTIAGTHGWQRQVAIRRSRL